MAKYYFDIETYSPGEIPNPKTDKIITIQFQELDTFKGHAAGPLHILKEWESSEKEIVKEFAEIFKPWDFIPVGNNLAFERSFLREKFRQHLGKKVEDGELDYNFPSIDIQPLFVLLNDGAFKGCGMHNFTAKKVDGSFVRTWYENKEYEKIMSYIKEEADAFIEFYQRACSIIPKSFLNKTKQQVERCKNF